MALPNAPDGAVLEEGAVGKCTPVCQIPDFPMSVVFQTFLVQDSALIKSIPLLFQCEAVCAMNTDTGSIRVSVQCSFTSTETTRTIRDREPRGATSTFTQLLSSEINQTF